MNQIRLLFIQIQALPRSMRHHQWKEINDIIRKGTNSRQKSPIWLKDNSILPHFYVH